MKAWFWTAALIVSLPVVWLMDTALGMRYPNLGWYVLDVAVRLIYTAPFVWLAMKSKTLWAMLVVFVLLPLVSVIEALLDLPVLSILPALVHDLIINLPSFCLVMVVLHLVLRRRSRLPV